MSRRARSPARSGLLLGLAMTGCAAPAPAPRPVLAQPVTTAVPLLALPPPAPPAPPPPPAAAVATLDPELVKGLDAAGLEKLEVAKSVCKVALQRDGGPVKVGCRDCPPFDGVEALDSSAEGAPFFELEALYSGSFSRPGASEKAAVFNGCEPHAANWGGTLLVEKRDAGWVGTSYRSGFHPGDCRVFRAQDGLDRLVCSWQTTHQGSSHWMLDTYDFPRRARTPEEEDPSWQRVFALDDNTAGECWGDPTAWIMAGSITGLRVVSVKPGAAPRVEVDVRTGRERPSAKLESQCAEREKHPDSAVDPVTPPVTSKRTLGFAWNGEQLVPDAATKAFLGALPAP